MVWGEIALGRDFALQHKAFQKLLHRVIVHSVGTIKRMVIRFPREIFKYRRKEPSLGFSRIEDPASLGSEPQSRSRKSAQDDKWSFCLTAGTL
jgi:hypothetical protein